MEAVAWISRKSLRVCTKLNLTQRSHNVPRRERGMSRESSRVPVCASPVNKESKREREKDDEMRQPFSRAPARGSKSQRQQEMREMRDEMR